MDPATAAGLALGVLPLIVSALENYDRIFQPLIIFTRSCRKEAEYFQLALRVQRTAFRNACRLLLYSATEYKLAVPDMLSGSQHQHLWRDGRFRERLEAQLGDSFEACVAALTLVKQTLDYLILRYDGVGLLLRDQGESEGSFLIRIKRLRQRTKISFTKTTIDETIGKLRAGNEDLERLSSQINQLQSTDIPTITSKQIPIARFAAMHNASRDLYTVLSTSWSCPAEHSANIALEIVPPEDPTARVQFTLAWTCSGNGQPEENVVEPLWLRIETCLDEPGITDKPYKEGSQSRADGLLAVLRNLQVEENSHSRSTSSSEAAIPTNMQIEPEESLDMIKDLCLHLRHKEQHQLQQPNLETSAHSIGYLQTKHNLKHSLYHHLDQNPRYQSLSLSDALIQAQSLLCGIPPVDRMHLAKALSMAVLHFHSTPWLDQIWQSTEVLFFGVQDLSQDLNPLSKPFLGPRPVRSIDQGKQKQAEQREVYSALAPNTLIYSLGVMLIELAFERPLSALQSPIDKHSGESPSLTLHRTVLRLADLVGKKVNIKYEIVVKRCLRCNFGQNSPEVDLERVSMQRAFYRNVVCELEKCFDAANIC